MCIQPPSLRIGKGWVPAMHFCVSHPLQSALENGQEATSVQIDFSAASDRVTIGEFSISSALWVFEVMYCLYYRNSYRIDHHVLVDGCRSKLVDVVSGVPQGSVLGLLFFLLYTTELFSILENKLISYADDYFDGCCTIPRRQSCSD